MLFAFPYSGGNAAALCRMLGPDVGRRVVAMDLPGHGARMREPLRTTIAEVVEVLGPEVEAAAAGRRFGVYGHSLGAVVAFEVATWLSRNGAPPDVVVVTGCIAPFVERRPEPPLSEQEVLERASALGGDMRAFDDPELREMFLPVLAADWNMGRSYLWEPTDPLPCPVIAARGADDPTVDDEGIAAWQAHSAPGFEQRTLRGGHFFEGDAADDLADLLDAVLRRLDALPASQ